MATPVYRRLKHAPDVSDDVKLQLAIHPQQVHDLKQVKKPSIVVVSDKKQAWTTIPESQVALTVKLDLKLAIEATRKAHPAHRGPIQLSVNVSSQYMPPKSRLVPIVVSNANVPVQCKLSVQRRVSKYALLHVRLYRQRPDADGHILVHEEIASGTIPFGDGDQKGTMWVCSTPRSQTVPVAAQCTADSKVEWTDEKLSSLGGATAHWTAYCDAIQTAVKQLPAKGMDCRLPSGKHMEFSFLGGEMIETSELSMPRLFYMLAVSQTHVDEHAHSALVDHLIRMTCVVEDLSVEKYQAMCLQPDFVEQFLPKMIKLLPSILLYTDGRGDSFTFPANQGDVATAAIDCREMSVLSGLIARFVSQSTSSLAYPLRTQLDKYHVVHVLCTSIGAGGTDGMHVACYLIPKALFTVYEHSSKTPPESKWTAFGRVTPQVDEAVCVIDATYNCCETWDGQVTRIYSTSDYELPISSFFRPRHTAHYVVAENMATSVLAMYVMDGPRASRQVFPLVFNEQTSQWNLGVLVKDLWRGLLPVTGKRFCFWCPVTPTESQYAATDALAKHVQHLNTIQFDPFYATLTDARVRQLVETDQKTRIKYMWKLYRKQDTTPKRSLKERVAQEVQDTIQLGHEHKLKVYDSMKVDVVIDSSEYVIDGLNDASLLRFS